MDVLCTQSLSGVPQVLIIDALRLILVEHETNLSAHDDLSDDHQREQSLRLAVRDRSPAHLQREEQIENRSHFIVGDALGHRSKHPEENQRQLEMAALAAQGLRAIDPALVESHPFHLEQSEARAFEQAHHAAHGQQGQAHESNQAYSARRTRARKDGSGHRQSSQRLALPSDERRCQTISEQPSMLACTLFYFPLAMIFFYGL